MSLDDDNGIDTDKRRNIYYLIKKFLYQPLAAKMSKRAVVLVRETTTAHAVLCTHSPSLIFTDHENDTN